MIFGEFANLKENDSFRQHHSTGFIQGRVDCFFISNSLQESIKITDTLVAFSTDHFPITFSLCHF